MNELMVTIML